MARPDSAAETRPHTDPQTLPDAELMRRVGLGDAACGAVLATIAGGRATRASRSGSPRLMTRRAR